MSVRPALISRLREARRQTDALFEWLTPQGLLERPIAERHRLIFYLGHLEAFDFNLISRECLGRKPRDATLESLFAFGIDPLDGDVPRDAEGDWPSREVIDGWRRAVRADVDADLESGPFNGWLSNGWAAHLAIEHRLMHAETLAYLLNRTPTSLKHRGPAPAVLEGPAQSQTVLSIPAGRATLGLSRQQFPHTGWDNEYDEHVVEVPAFEVDRLPVTNGDYLRFVDAGGYRARELWSEPAFSWLTREGLSHPTFWARHDGRWWWKAMFGEVPLPLSWPVYVSHAEASAYLKWKGGRLMTEAEWHRAALGTREGSERSTPWGSVIATPGVHGTFGFSSVDPLPVGSHPLGRSAFGVDELVGNGWEWTSTVFAPFAGFEPLPFYKGYSANFFDGKHFVLKGASARTDVSFLRRSFRNWFQGSFPSVFAKFRVVPEGMSR